MKHNLDHMALNQKCCLGLTALLNRMKTFMSGKTNDEINQDIQKYQSCYMTIVTKSDYCYVVEENMSETGDGSSSHGL